MTSAPLKGWDIRIAADAEWVPWGEGGNARAKILGTGDGYVLAIVEADEGYTGTPHAARAHRVPVRARRSDRQPGSDDAGRRRLHRVDRARNTPTSKPRPPPPT